MWWDMCLAFFFFSGGCSEVALSMLLDTSHFELERSEVCEVCRI